MIQRIQSLFWLVSVAVSAALFFTPISQKVVFDPAQGDLLLNLYAHGYFNGSEAYLSVWPITVVTLLVGLLSLAVIFLYKNRPLQIKLGMFLIVLSCLLLAGLFFYADTVGESTDKSHYLVGTYLMFLQLYVLMRAVKAVKKDEELVRSADRIR